LDFGSALSGGGVKTAASPATAKKNAAQGGRFCRKIFFIVS
jgi:hypothetical protein